MDIIDKATIEQEHFDRLMVATLDQQDLQTDRQLQIDAFASALDSVDYLHARSSLTDEQHATISTLLLDAARVAASEAPLVRPPAIGDLGHRVGTQLTSFLFTTDRGGPNRYNDQMGAEYEDKIR